MPSSFRTLSGILLVIGTCVGAGMLALPVVTGIAGFWPAITVNLACCLFMMATGLLLLEAILWMEDGANVLTLADHFFGKWGKIVGGVSFLFLYYCLQVSYCAGGTPAFAQVIEQISGIKISGVTSYLIFAAFFGVIVYLGASTVNRLNWILMTGLVVSYFLLIFIGSGQVNPQLLHHTDWTLSLAAMPTLFGAYGYQNLLPSLSTFLKRHILSLRLSVIFGTLLPFVIYSVWQWMIMGTMTLEQIQEADLRGEPITQALQNIVGSPWLRLLGEFFGFFALTTSLIGVSLSMVDFLGDGLHIKRRVGWRRALLCLAVFLPPALFAAANPDIFIEAIGVAGGYGEAVLNGLFPIAMVWVGRYYLKLPSEYSLWGGKPLLIALTLMTLIIMGIETVHLYNQ